MNMDKLTTSMRNALLNDSQSIAVGNDNNQVDTVHVLLALFEQSSSTVKEVIRRCGANVGQLEQQLRDILNQQPQISNPDGQVQLAAELARLLNLADKEAKKLGDQYLSSEVFFLVTLEERGAIGKALKEAGLTKEAVNKAINNSPKSRNLAPCRICWFTL